MTSPLRTVALRKGAPGQPAVSLAKVEAAAGVDMRKRTEAAGGALAAAGLLGHRFAAVALLDASHSMSRLYRDGTVQTLVDRALAWTLNVDDDGNIPVGLFGSEFTWGGDVNLDSYAGVVDREGWRPSGSTNLTAALVGARELLAQATEPGYLFVVTDGSPNDRASATREIVAMSQEPIFVKFLVIGRSAPGLEYAELLDDLEEPKGRRTLARWGLPARLIDNVDTQRVADPGAIGDDAFAAAMTEELPSWLANAQRVGLVR
jgi:hypothetical protein